MTKSQRLAVLLALSAILATLFYFHEGRAFPAGESGVVVFSALLLMALTTLVLEHYFVRPTDVIAAATSILLLLAPLRSFELKWGAWYQAYFVYCALMLVIATASLLLYSPAEPEGALPNRVARLLKVIATRVGSGKVMYFLLFLLTALFFVDSQNPFFFALIGFSGLVILIDPSRLARQLTASAKTSASAIGTIFGVQSRNVFLVKLAPQRDAIRLFDFVEFQYRVGDHDKLYRGLILDHYLLNEGAWVRVLCTEEIQSHFSRTVSGQRNEPNLVYKLEATTLPSSLERFVGVVVEDSRIGRIRFSYSHRVQVAEGQLVEARVQKARVLYQVIDGATTIEQLELKNECGYIVGEAMQLGVWDETRKCFDRHGWVPDVNTPLYLPEQHKQPALTENEFAVGTVPGTDLPILLDTHDAVTHHMAVLGVTGTGKSVFARNLIRQFVRDGIKVVCVDFTGEYKSRLSDLQVRPIVAGEDSTDIFKAVDYIAAENDKFANLRDAKRMTAAEGLIEARMKDAVVAFLDTPQTVGTFELPDVVNSAAILNYTRWFFRTLFDVARERGESAARICVVLEEAHTVVPEWNFAGTSDKNAQSVVNSIGQIALQGRKYGVGFLVIAQRTANVSKTVLTQCNTLVTFQTFDNTSRDFLSNYLGGSMVQALPNLRQRHAIAVGKAFRSTVPLIFEVPDIVEPSPENAPAGAGGVASLPLGPRMTGAEESVAR